MATRKGGGGGPEKPPQEDRTFARLVGDSTQVTTGITSYVGLLGRSTKEGYWLLFTSLDMSVSVEFREEDIVHSEQLPPDRSPFGALGGTQVFVRKDAMVRTTRTVSRRHEAGTGADEFDLDIRLGGGPAALMAQPCFGTQHNTTCGAECPGGGSATCGSCLSCNTCVQTCLNNCLTDFGTCTDCNQATCNTCKTQCGQITCQATCQTCQTKCGQATCNTCQTKCGQATCNTCQTKCGQNTCQKTMCDTCPDDSCGGCTHITCFNTCGGLC